MAFQRRDRVPGTQSTNLVNVARFALSSPSRALVMARKVLRRFDGLGAYSNDENVRWIEANSISSADYAKTLDPDLWKEAEAFGKKLDERSAKIIPTIPFDVGGGGDYPFLYFLTRLLKPNVIVETGVCAGWSSQAFLAALHENGEGRLYSSDFPLFRVKDPERYIGILVEDHLKDRWNLFTKGDEVDLPRIVDSVQQIDLFHYDSDKSYSGRQFAANLVVPKLKGPFIMDDIKDNSWFREFSEGKNFKVIGRSGFIA